MGKTVKREIYELEQMAEVICGQLGRVGPEYHEYAGVMQDVHSYRNRRFNIELVKCVCPNLESFEIKHLGQVVVSGTTFVRHGVWESEYNKLYSGARAMLSVDHEKMKREAGMFAWALPIYGRLPEP